MAAETVKLDPERARAFLYLAARRVSEAIDRLLNEERGRMNEEVGMGADGTPTKYIDEVAEKVILDTLEESGIELNVLSEEAGHIDNGATYTLVIDPIDGTRNAGHGVPFHCISMAIGRSSLADLEYALIRNLATGDFYYARQGHGATVNGEPFIVRPTDRDELLVSAVFDEPQHLQTYWSHPNIHLRDMGSSALEMALVATGAFDAFVCPFPFLRVIDIAAATLIVREAGGEVYDHHRKVLDMPYDLKPRAGVIAVSRAPTLELLP